VGPHHQADETDRLIDWSGVFAVMTTPFNPDLSLDEDGLRRNCGSLTAVPVDVVICLGSEGEFYALTTAERQRVLEIVVDEISGRKPVICGISHTSTIDSTALAAHARTTGADAVMATPPYYGRPNFDSIAQHFAAIAEAARLPLFVYNTPRSVGYGLTPDELVRLSEIADIAGVKQAASDLTELTELLARIGSRGLRVVGGSEMTMWPALCAGAHGNTATAASALPKPFADMWAAATSGDLNAGRDIHCDLEQLRRAYRVAGGQAGVVKRLLDLVGLAGGPVRNPTPPAPPPVDELIRPLVNRWRKTA
jgi:4-hydroxy-tetrahydrodipicolinate synthase